ncbi:MAG: DNA polymerase III subunit gamma/tau, partial [Firmicutes bacterium]|nr:DNA polymerase III subunit gamma/tau [Bacillota bacterium]
MTYRALYREWRPQSFADVVGQEHVVTTLKSALRLDRLAHAYLFSGPRGTGKTTLAKLLAKAVNCEARVDGCEPCNQCPTCMGIMAGSIMDVTEMDAASNRGVDEIRSILEQVQYPPADVRVKAYIIDEVHMLTPEAFNALLKTLEEPPSYCLFVLATTELHKVPATIVSRCQRFELGRVAPELVVARLRQVVDHLAVDVEEAALWQIARVTDGGLRDALSLLDQVLAFAADVVTVDEVSVVLGGVPSERLGQVYGALLRGEATRLFDLLGPIWAQGTDPSQLIVELIAYGRDGLLLKTGAKGLGADQRARYDPTFELVVRDASTGVLLAILERLAQVQSEMRYQTQGQLVVEMALFSCLGLVKAPVPAAASAAPVAVTTTAAAESAEAGLLRDELARLTARVAQLEAAARAVRAPQSADAPPVQVPAARIAQDAIPEPVLSVAKV